MTVYLSRVAVVALAGLAAFALYLLNRDVEEDEVDAVGFRFTPTPDPDAEEDD